MAAMLARGKVRAIDVGLASFRRADQSLSRYFVNVAGAGFDGEVSDLVNREGKRGGSLAYFLNVFKVLAGYQNKRATLRLIEPDKVERVIEGEFNLIAACNGRYFGGGMMIGPHADVGDGLFDVVVIEAMSRAEFALAFPRVYRGTHLTHPKVKAFRAPEVRIQPPPEGESRGEGQRMFLEAEGELFGEAPAEFHLLPGALRLIVP
jgi:diacylglycerol kinase family enzyme